MVAAALVAAAVAVAAGVAQAQARKATDGWQRSSPSEQGLDAGHLKDLVQRLRSEERGVRSVVVVRNGRLVLEYYREGLGPSTLHDMRSATMCVVSTLVGVALQKGLIRSVDQPIADFLPEALGEDVDPRVKTMTLGHILTMTAGFDPAANQVGKWTFPGDFALRRPLVSDPGTTFNFDSGTAQLAARVLVSATRERVSQFARTQLFRPLGIQRYLWQIDKPGGGELGYSSLQLTARDMAKLGQLQLQQGTWSAIALMPAGYSDAATKRQSAGGPPMNWGYGY
jgi:CubicO group peptidase (beta-lactamase class C family)